MKKRILAMALSLGLIAGCAGGDTPAGAVEDAGNEPAGAAEEDTQSASAEGGALDDAALASLSSLELSYYMGNGINLGNTMEATDNTDFNTYELSHWEMLWGQPLTTKEMIDDMKAAGLDTLRIPVAWTNNMDFLNGDYTIDPALISRVKEIVDWAREDDMFVVVNDHWDRGWWGMFGSEDAAQRDAAMEMYKSMWTQLAEEFKDYDLHLILEGGNEEIGDRLNDINDVINPKGAVLSKDECYAKANEINQAFVDTVRASGGNNENRFLLIPGYGTDITQTLDERWHMPNDSAKDKLFLSVHYYNPWNYCGGSGSSTWGTQKNYEEMDILLERLEKAYGSYGVIIGECGVLPTSSGEMKPNTLLWMKHFFANCEEKNFVPLLWNTGDILNKRTHSWIDAEYEQFLKDHSYEALADKYPDRDAINTACEEALAEGRAAAPESFQQDAILSGDGTAVAWIMWNSQDWSCGYSVGDTYNPDDITEGIVPTVVEVKGEGIYTVALDFSGTEKGYSNSTAFSAIGIANAEELFPGYVLTIDEILINGEEYKMHGRNYTSSDDGLCTRSNLYNEWVNAVPDDARTKGGGIVGASPTLLDPKDDALSEVRSISITFSYTPGAEGISPNDANSKN